MAALTMPFLVSPTLTAVSILKAALSWCLLRLQYVALVDPAAAKEAVAHHVLAKQKNDHYQQD
jgi:hypothetical protein